MKYLSAMNLVINMKKHRLPDNIALHVCLTKNRRVPGSLQISKEYKSQGRRGVLCDAEKYKQEQWEEVEKNTVKVIRMNLYLPY